MTIYQTQDVRIAVYIDICAFGVTSGNRKAYLEQVQQYLAKLFSKQYTLLVQLVTHTPTKHQAFYQSSIRKLISFSSPFFLLPLSIELLQTLKQLDQTLVYNFKTSTSESFLYTLRLQDTIQLPHSTDCITLEGPIVLQIHPA